MLKARALLICMILICFAGCAIGVIKENKFYLENDFEVQLLDDDWQVIRQMHDTRYPRQVNMPEQIGFGHKKSNGYISAYSFVMSDIQKARPLSVHADAAVAGWRGTKLSEKQTKIDGVDAVEVIMSGSRMVKWIFVKKGDKAYQLMYSNTQAYFDDYLGVFDKFIATFKILEPVKKTEDGI